MHNYTCRLQCTAKCYVCRCNRATVQPDCVLYILSKLVKFRYIVFRPFKDEILSLWSSLMKYLFLARCCNIHPDCILIFFRLIYGNNLEPLCVYTLTKNHFSLISTIAFVLRYSYVVKLLLKSKISDYEEQLWLWEYQTENRIHDLFMDVNKEVRFRVVDHIFADSAPVSDTAQKEDNENESYDCSKSPYTIIGTINHPGLGLVTWWNN
ncbi:DNA-directed RNA polymerase III subunit RPC8 [Trichoplax sp. H2]|nr:DNA-directed RNA polymerase III subunit RPC8 [Trichoplax sp. H2]|eukprot:RDD44418.1 DNA-directed RNA polymerase III subunit RPC8 [Trichoplax sp. H2]